MSTLSTVISVIVGMFISLQGVINSEMGRRASLAPVIFSVSIVQAILVLIWLMKDGPIKLSVFTSWQIWVAGILGVIIMFGIPWAITINGSLLTFILVIYGQLLFSGFSDYFGWFGVDPHPISLTRIISFLFIGIGIFLLYIESFFG